MGISFWGSRKRVGELEAYLKGPEGEMGNADGALLSRESRGIRRLIEKTGRRQGKT